MTRRRFLGAAGTAAAVSLAAGCSPVWRRYAGGSGLNLLVSGGLLYDGLGGAPFIADIGIADGRVVAIGKISRPAGCAVIDARDRAVSPGFIDVHDHSDVGLLANPRAESAIRQGVTTIVSGQCGSTPFPLAEATFEEMKSDVKDQLGVDIDWRDLRGFLARLEKSGLALNFATLVGHGSLRGAAMGFNDRPPSADELERMKSLLAADLAEGAFGLSTGLEYTPGSFADAAEVTALCRVVAARGGVYATHMRDEGDRLLESLTETLATARGAGVKLQISHFKTAFPRNWGKLRAALELLEKAHAEGLDVTCDRYPYIAGSTGLSINFPAWAREGTTAEFVARLKDPTLDARLREYVAGREKLFGSWDKVIIASVATEPNKKFIGLDVLAASRSAGRPPYEFMRDLLIEERDAVESVLFMMSEDNLRRILAHPLIGVGSDSAVRAPYGLLSAGKPHPRAYGTFPRILGRYVREEKILPAETMIRKMTSAPARKFGIAGRGVLRPGACADLLVFDPVKVIDRATWTEPHTYPGGIDHIVVNGVVVVSAGEHTGRLPGRVLRMKAGS